MQGDQAMLVSDYILLTSSWLFHCLPNSGVAGAKWAKTAQQLGKVVGLQD